MKCYTITREDTYVTRENIKAQSAEDAVYWAFGDRVRYLEKEGNKEIYVNAGCKNSYKVEEVQQVELTSKDIIRIVEYICKQNSTVREEITWYHMEELLMNAIHHITQVNFTEEVEKLHKG